MKICNATAGAKTAHLNLSRFKVGKFAEKMTISGQPEDENNFDKQPIAPKQETVKAEKKFGIDLEPYSMVMLEYQL